MSAPTTSFVISVPMDKLHTPRPNVILNPIRVNRLSLRNYCFTLPHPSYVSSLFTVLQILSRTFLHVLLFFDDFPSLLERLVSSLGYLLLAGDFNFPVNDPSDNTANRFLDLLNCFNLEIRNVYPRHIKTKTSWT